MAARGRRLRAGVAAAACVWISSDGNALRARQAAASPASMTFFVTSVGRGFGGNLGGLTGADNHCQRLAEGVGHGGHTWRAYLSAPATASRPVVHARDRIGKGPWVNAAGVRIAADLRDLHSAENQLGGNPADGERDGRGAW